MTEINAMTEVQRILQKVIEAKFKLPLEERTSILTLKHSLTELEIKLDSTEKRTQRDVIIKHIHFINRELAAYYVAYINDFQVKYLGKINAIINDTIHFISSDKFKALIKRKSPELKKFLSQHSLKEWHSWLKQASNRLAMCVPIIAQMNNILTSDEYDFDADLWVQLFAGYGEALESIATEIDSYLDDINNIMFALATLDPDTFSTAYTQMKEAINEAYPKVETPESLAQRRVERRQWLINTAIAISEQDTAEVANNTN